MWGGVAFALGSGTTFGVVARSCSIHLFGGCFMDLENENKSEAGAGGELKERVSPDPSSVYVPPVGSGWDIPDNGRVLQSGSRWLEDK